MKSQIFFAYQPLKHFIDRIIRSMYASVAKEWAFEVAYVHDFVFEKSKVSVSIVLNLLYGKFVVHMPIDRMLNELLRENIPTNSAIVYN
jgi:hypothetical protein